MATFTHGKGTKVLVEGIDLSTFFKEYNYQAKMDAAETSTFGTSTKTYVQGMSDSTLSLSGYFDGSANAVDAVLAAAIGATSDAEVTISPTGVWTLGSAVIAGRAVQTDYSVQGSIGSVVEVSAAFQSDGAIRSGVSIHDLAAETVGTLGTAVDTGRASSNGGILVVQVTTNTMNAGATIKVQSSTTSGGSYVDYTTTAIALTTGQTGGFSVVVPPGTTCNAFLKCLTTYAGTGSCTFQASFVRF